MIPVMSMIQAPIIIAFKCSCTGCKYINPAATPMKIADPPILGLVPLCIFLLCAGLSTAFILIASFTMSGVISHDVPLAMRKAIINSLLFHMDPPTCLLSLLLYSYSLTYFEQM